MLRDRWAEVLEAVKQERKVAWILLEKATVESLSDGALTLNFTNEGYAKGFGSSGYDADLGRVLKNMFGISPQIRAITGGTGGQSGPGGPGGSGGHSGGGGGQSGAGFGSPPGPSGSPTPGGRAPESGGSSSAGSGALSASASASPGPAPASAPAQPVAAQPPVRQIADEEFVGDYEDYEDYEEDDSPGGRPGGARTGSVDAPSSMALIERELGGKIIE